MLNRSMPYETKPSNYDIQYLGDEIKEIIQIINYVLVCGVVSVLGTVANVINLIIFYRQGLDTTINISFFALAISDLSSLIMQQCYNVCVNPRVTSSGVPLVTSGIQFIVAGVPRECFARITCLITVYITAERCFCITFPLHVKQMFTPRRTSITVILIYSLTFASVCPLYFTTSISWNFYPDRNRTLLGLAFTSNSDKVEGIVMVIHAVVATMSFLAVVFLTLMLIQKLGEKTRWRQETATDHAKTGSMTNRDRKTITMVVLIATILIVSYTPSVILFLITFIEPDFSIGGKYSNLYTISWSLACVSESINSSVNIFLYLKMSTKYRNTFHELFSQNVKG